MGHAVLPLLNQQSEAATGELQATLRNVIRSIWATDPLCMVSPPERRITADIKEATAEEARRILFADFPLCPPIDELLEVERRSEKRVMKANLRLDNATYWQAILAYSATFELELEPDIRNTFGEGKYRQVRWSRPAGTAIVSATWKRDRNLMRDQGEDNEKDIFTVRLHLEPGFQPIDGYLHITRITDSTGALRSSEATVHSASWHHDFMSPTGDRHMPTLTEMEIEVPTGKMAPSLKLTIKGWARFSIPKEVECAVWRLKSWQSHPSRIMRGSRIVLEDFKVRGKHGDITVSTVGLEENGVAADREESNSAWVIIASDDGHSVNPLTIGLGGRGAGGAGVSFSWDHPEPPTRVCLIRPMVSRIIEFPFEITDVPIPSR